MWAMTALRKQQILMTRAGSPLPYLMVVDNKEVFNGNTKPGLGYFTAVCKPTKGKTVTVLLNNSGAVKNESNFGVEMNGKNLDDGIKTANSNAKGALSIIEADIFENP